MSVSHETEDQLIHRAQQALSNCNWEIGACAAEWTRKFAKGRTDGDFGALIGLSGDQVYQRRRVWETFADVYEQYPQLKWSHFYAGINWDDAAECLQWANDMGATVAEMKAWRRAQRGEDLSQPAAEEAPFGDEPSPEFLTVGAGYVQDYADAPARNGGDRGERTSSGSEERSPVATAVARDAEGSEYAPYGKGARGPAPGEAGANDSAPPLQVLKRVTTALERVDASLTPSILEAFRESPIAIQQRFLTAVENIISKTRGLD